MIATCPERQLLRDYANGIVSEVEADDLTAHLHDCPSCQSWLNSASDLDDTLIGQLRHCSTTDDSFDQEPQCQSAMARALGALAAVGELTEEDVIDLPGSIGDYEIVRRIGHGGMGNVYLAQHTRLNRTVAVKILASHRLSDSRMHQRFEKEMRAVESLAHPNIVTAHDARDVDGVALLVTEWIDGLDLKEILHRVGPLSVADASEIGVRIASALSYIADQDLVHRDLKPSNVMINGEGEVKLLDLGLARLRSGEGELDATATGQAMGTADYVAPEQINDAREVDIRADIYGLGCTLYKLLSGRAPFEGDRYHNAFAKLTAHVSEQPPSLRDAAPSVPPAIAKLVDQMIGKSPSDRPASPDAIAAALKCHASGADLPALVRKALASERSMVSTSELATSRPPSPQRFWKRRVPLAVAIASGLGGIILGWCAGVLITITHPDDTKTSVDVPAGSHTTISESGDVDVRLRGTDGSERVPHRAAASPGIMDQLENLAPPDDSARFNGVWQVGSVMSHAGSEFEISGDHTSLVFHGDDFVIMRRSKLVTTGRWSIDSDLTRLTFTFGASDVEQKFKAIYRFLPDGNLQFCIGEKDFPNAFGFPATTDVTAGKIELPTAPAEAAAFLQDAINRDVLHAVALYERFKSGDSTAAFVEAVESPDRLVDRLHSENNLKLIGIAFHNYHDAYGAFPTSRCGRVSPTPAEGKPPVSWRVAILPFVGHNELFEQYDFDEAWNGPHNSRLLAKMPDIYRHPGSAPGRSLTAYFGFTGENTLLGSDKPTQMKDIIDGTSNTIMIVEVPSSVSWTMPYDIPVSRIVTSSLVNREGIILVSMADMSIQQFERSVTAQRLRDAVIINDGKK